MKNRFEAIFIFALLIGLGSILVGCGGTSTQSNTTPIATASLCLENENAATQHFHPFLGITINNSVEVIPAGVGIQEGCTHVIHTHSTTDATSGYVILHVESPDVRTFYLKDFFNIWGKTFNKDQILDSKVDSTHEIVMTVDEKPSTDYENLVLADAQRIVIRYQVKQ